MPLGSFGIVQARKYTGKRIVTSGFKPTTGFFTRGNSLRRVSQATTSLTGHCGPATSSRGIVERYTRFMGWAGLKPPNARFGYNTLRPFLIGRTGFAHPVVST